MTKNGLLNEGHGLTLNDWDEVSGVGYDQDPYTGDISLI
jgi:hypothetical protein